MTAAVSRLGPRNTCRYGCPAPHTTRSGSPLLPTLPCAEKPKLSPTNTKALNRMKQTLRKHLPAFAEQMGAYRENPVSEEEEEEAAAAGGASSESESEGERERASGGQGALARVVSNVHSTPTRV